MRVDVDEARRNNESVHIDGLARRAGGRPDRRDPVALHRDIGNPLRLARAVNDPAAANDDVVSHNPFSEMRSSNCRRFRPDRKCLPRPRLTPPVLSFAEIRQMVAHLPGLADSG